MKYGLICLVDVYKRKETICIYENKGAGQLCQQRFWFRSIDITMSLFSLIFNLRLQPCFCGCLRRTWSETQIQGLVFSCGGSFVMFILNQMFLHDI